MQKRSILAFATHEAQEGNRLNEPQEFYANTAPLRSYNSFARNGPALSLSVVGWLNRSADWRDAEHRDKSYSGEAGKDEPYALVTAPVIKYPAGYGWAYDVSYHSYAHHKAKYGAELTPTEVRP